VSRGDFDIVVVGAGIAGSALALALRGSGWSVALVEAGPAARPELPAERGLLDFDRRVVALNPRSRRFLQDLGAWSAVADYRCCPYRHMTVWDGDGTACVEFDASETGGEELGVIVENRALVSALLEALAGQRELAWLAPETVSDIRPGGPGWQLQLASGRRLEAALVVAADGALSPLRELAGFPTREWDYGHRAIVATVELDGPHGDTAWQRFSDTGPLALLPLPGSGERHFCSIVWSQREARAAELLALDDEAFRRALEAACEGRPAGIVACSPRVGFPLRQRHARDYVQPGLALVADAAHTIHPLAGQGLNLGLQDVAVLAAELQRAQRRGLAPGDLAVLRRYQRQRKGENLLMMAAMEGFKRLFEAPEPPVRWLRNSGMRLFQRATPLKQQVMHRAMGL